VSRTRVQSKLSLFLTATLGLYLLGCVTPSNSFDITDHRDPFQDRQYHENFDEAYYDLDSEGNVQIVLRRTRPMGNDPKEPLTQVIHLKTFWRPIPGRTVAERTQINGFVSYLIVGGGVGATFEGAGSVFMHQNKKGSVLTGTMEYAVLKPKRRLAADNDIFAQAELKGHFRARRDARRVVSIVNDLNRLFGPLPPYSPPERDVAASTKESGR